MDKIKVRISEMVPGRLPRIPKSEWASKRRKPEKITVQMEELTEVGGVPTWVKYPDDEIEMPGGLYLEDILIWCNCKEPEDGDYIEEPDGTHGVVCARCGGVIQLG